MAGDDDDENAEGEALDDRDRDVGDVGVVLDPVVPIRSGDFEGEDADDVGGKDAEGGGLGDEEGDRDDHGEESRGDEEVDRMHGHGAQGIDLLGDFHRTDLRCHGRANTTCEHEAGDGRAEFTEHADADERTSQGFGIEELELKKRLRGQHGTGEGAGDDDDGLRAVTDFCDLIENLPSSFTTT